MNFEQILNEPFDSFAQTPHGKNVPQAPYLAQTPFFTGMPRTVRRPSEIAILHQGRAHFRAFQIGFCRNTKQIMAKLRYTLVIIILESLTKYFKLSFT